MGRDSNAYLLTLLCHDFVYSYEAEGMCCSYCDLVYCKDCNSSLDSGEELCSCNQCRKSCCNSCRLRIYQEGGDHCIDCIRLLPHEEALVEKVERLKTENMELKNVNKELPHEATLLEQYRRLQQEVKCLEKENRELKLEIEHLKDKNK